MFYMFPSIKLYTKFKDCGFLILVEGEKISWYVTLLNNAKNNKKGTHTCQNPQTWFLQKDPILQFPHC